MTYSDWSETYPEGVNDGLVESQAEYRYYTYETQTVTNASSLSGDGWELVSTNTYWSDYGSWSAWQDTSVSSSDSRKVESRKVYRYYYFYCPVCGGREPLQGLSDCHSYTLTQSDAVEGWFTTSYADSNSQTYSYTTAKRYTTSLGDGLIWNFSTGNLSDTAAGTIESDSEAVVIKMQYRYCTRSQVTEYTYQRASEWSEWTTDASEIPSGAVTESRTVYRYITSGLGEHSWDEGTVTTEPTTDSAGIRTYTCTVCGDTKEETIDKLAAITINTQPTDYMGTAGSTASFTVIASGSGLSYKWQYSDDGGVVWNDSTASSASSMTYKLTMTAARDGRIVRCVITDVNGNSVTSATAAMILETSLEITSQPMDYSGTVGSLATFTVVAEGTGLTYQWQYSDDSGKTWVTSTATSAKAATYTSTLTAARDGRMVRCIVTDVNGDSVTSEKASMTVKSSISIVSQPSDYTGAAGSKVSFTVVAQGTGLTYQWQYSDNNGASWVNSTASSAYLATYTSTMTAARDGRMVRCIVTDVYGNSVTSTVATMYLEAATALAVTGQPSDYTGTVGSTASFTVTATGTGLTYQWQYSDNNGNTWVTSTASSAKSATYTSTLTAARDGRMVRCIVTDASGNSVTSDAATMSVKAALTITKQPADYTGSAGSTAIFTIIAEGTGLTYQWQYSDSNGKTWSVSTATSAKSATYTSTLTAARDGRKVRCVVTDANGNMVTSDEATMRIG